MVIKEIRFECSVHPSVGYYLRTHADNALLQVGSLSTLEDFNGVSAKMRTFLGRRLYSGPARFYRRSKICYVDVVFTLDKKFTIDRRNKLLFDFFVKGFKDRVCDLFVCLNISHLCAVKLMDMKTYVNSVFYKREEASSVVLTEWYDRLFEKFGDIPLIHKDLGVLWPKYRNVLECQQESLLGIALKNYRSMSMSGEQDSLLLEVGYSLMVLEALAGLPKHAAGRQIVGMLSDIMPNFIRDDYFITEIYRRRNKILHGYPLDTEVLLSPDYSVDEREFRIVSLEYTDYSALAMYLASLALQYKMLSE